MSDEMTPRQGTSVSASDATKIQFGEQRVKGVVFVAGPIIQPAPHRLYDTRHRHVVHVSTDDLTRTAHIRRVMVEQIAEAKQKVLFCSFLFADEEIVSALCEAAERLHGGVYVLTALGKHLRAEVLEPDSDVDANTAKLQDRAKRHEEHLQRLAHAGVWLRSAEDCHAKFCVVDDACAFVTSANATQEAYESNPEDGLVVFESRAAREFGRLFAHVWQHLSTLESTPGTRLDVHTLAAARPPEWRELGSSPALRPVTTLRGYEASLCKAATEIIDRATGRLAIATYSFMGMEDHPIGAALANALARNVRIDLLVQPRNHIEAQRTSLAWLKELAPERVRIYGHRRTHTKSIVADGQMALLWTGNLEARHGWDNGIEVGILVEDVGVASAVAGWTGDVMRRATHVALNTPTVRELVSAGQPQALSGEWTVMLPPGTQENTFTQALSRNPVELLEVQGAFVLRCADEILFDIRVEEASRRIDVLRSRRAEGLMGTRSKGWLATSVLHVVAAPAHQPAQGRSPQHQPQQRRGSKGRR